MPIKKSLFYQDMDTIKNIIGDSLMSLTHDLDPETKLFEDLGADIYDRTEMIGHVEEHFNINYSPFEIEQIKTVQHVIDLAYLKFKSPSPLHGDFHPIQKNVYLWFPNKKGWTIQDFN